MIKSGCEVAMIMIENKHFHDICNEKNLFTLRNDTRGLSPQIRDDYKSFQSLRLLHDVFTYHKVK